jgi:thiol:disulfide interchange protein DsbD
LAAQRPSDAVNVDAVYSSASQGGLDAAQLRSNLSDQGAGASMPMMMLFGFLGGLILNLMPCVLPVIGLKILSFVEQSGQDRSRVLLLNIWYSLGLLSVFMVLALLAIFLGLGWGQQFSSSVFNVVLAGIVFAMGLSFLGVWEIPIPGFVGSGKANDLAAKEGISGAFAKGAITTVLATPCTGPFLGTSLAWAVRQPPQLTLLLFLCVGLGMASPYLVIGMFPSLVRVLPKPGMWMETFKQSMGFVLLGTVVFLLTFIEWSLVVPTVAMLFGIWAACWWIGRTPYTADFDIKARAWLGAATFTAAIALVSFTWLHGEMSQRLTMLVDREMGQRLRNGTGVEVAQSGHRLPWQPFSQESLKELTGEQKTVMVDFTADWCLICKTLEAGVLNTDSVKKVVDSNGVVPLLADWTSGDEEVSDMLELLGSKMVPVLAIFPAGRPNEPIVFRDPYTQQQLIDALEKAGPSKAAAGNEATAMNAR